MSNNNLFLIILLIISIGIIQAKQKPRLLETYQWKGDCHCKEGKVVGVKKIKIYIYSDSSCIFKPKECRWAKTAIERKFGYKNIFGDGRGTGYLKWSIENGQRKFYQDQIEMTSFKQGDGFIMYFDKKIIQNR